MHIGMERLEDKVILVTGGCGRIGSAICVRALELGATVIAADNDRNRLIRLIECCNKENKEKLFTVEADLTTSEGIKTMVQTALEKAGKITSAIHSAYPRSKQWGKPFEEIEYDSLAIDLKGQLGSAIIFSQSILEYFKENGGGDLIHLGSIQGISAPKFEHYHGTTMTSPIEYAAIKAGIISITRWLAKYYTNCGIRVNCVSPGGILDQQPESFLMRYRDSCTNIGMLDAENAADVILFLLAEGAKAINGQNIVVDDGWSL